MGNLLRSRDDMISLAQTYGAWKRSIATFSPATTAATTNSGKISVKRYPDGFTVPSLGSGITAAYFTEIAMAMPIAVSTLVAAHETLLGSLTVSTNTFSSGSAMPTKTIEGASVTTASVIPILVATVALTATTPVVTITYTDQDGNTGNTCTMTLPTNSTRTSGYLMTPHLASGDTGVRAVTNMSISTGSAGTLAVYGLLPQAVAVNSITASGTYLNALTAPLPMIPFSATEVLGIYQFGVATATDVHVSVCVIGDD